MLCLWSLHPVQLCRQDGKSRPLFMQTFTASPHLFNPRNYDSWNICPETEGNKNKRQSVFSLKRLREIISKNQENIPCEECTLLMLSHAYILICSIIHSQEGQVFNCIWNAFIHLNYSWNLRPILRLLQVHEPGWQSDCKVLVFEEKGPRLPFPVKVSLFNQFRFVYFIQSYCQWNTAYP